MGAVYGFVGNVDQSYLAQMRGRLQHRGSVVREWSPARGAHFGELRVAESPEHNHPELPLAAHLTVYNPADVARRLGSNGASPVGDAYTLVYELMRRHGPQVLEHLNGDFALALWDDERQQLTLARDPLGVCPLYYYYRSDLVAFASEYKALLVLPDVEIEPDLGALQQLQDSKYLSPEGTLFQSIHQAPAGEYLTIRNNSVSAQRFWDVEIQPQEVSREQAEEDLRDHFFRAIERRLDGMDPVAVELSGGIDSAAIVAVAHRLRPDARLKTFTIGSGPDDAEVQAARIVAEEFKTDHHEIFLDLECLLEDLPTLVWHLEDPVGRTESYLQYYMSRHTSQHVNLVLGGYASDSLYAGMPKHKLLKMAQLAPIGRGAIEEFYHYTQTSREPRSLLGRSAKRLYFGKQELPPPTIVGAPAQSEDSALPRLRRGLIDHMLRASVLFGVPTWMPKMEKSHLAHGVEFRSPFTDPQLARHSFQIPERYKMHYLKEKYVLRRAILPLLPPKIANRPKFPQRISYDLELSRIIDRLAEQYIDSRALRNRGLFREDEIEALRRRPSGQSYTGNRAMRLWTVIVTELWAQIFIDNRGARPVRS
ncbi:MAG: asparagine synthase (glutamine-hydrolyzing) [Chloroflexota bacterium]